ncbi:hypothetical protein [Haladaptatus caseinilyticus]|nr:hypothetical protein [Haladaptatus caseinilyticus]
MSYLLSNLFAGDAPWWVVVTTIGALSLGYMGFDITRGGRRFDVSTDS